MVVGLLGRKVGMTQIFDPTGQVIPVTVIEAGPCHVLQVRTQEKDGYEAVQLGYLDKPRRLASRAARGPRRQTQRNPAHESSAANVGRRLSASPFGSVHPYGFFSVFSGATVPEAGVSLSADSAAGFFSVRSVMGM